VGRFRPIKIKVCKVANILNGIKFKYSFTDSDEKGTTFGANLEELGFKNIQIPLDINGTDMWDWAVLEGKAKVRKYLINKINE
jgi:hypothetical protein